MQQMDFENIRGSVTNCSRRSKIYWISTFVIFVAAFTLITVLVITKRTKSDFRVKWEGNCPIKTSQCPKSYLGVQAPLLLISVDGFRPSYLHQTRTLQKLARCGVSTNYLLSVFPTKTFPNHFSQVTGLYPESHGIVDNTIKDGEFEFRPGNNQSFWWQAEPIWVTAEKHGKPTATFFWPGSDVKMNGILPTNYRVYDQSIDLETRVDQVLKWLDLEPGVRPAFITLYMEATDTAAHAKGTKAPETNEAIQRVDLMLDRLFAGLQDQKMSGCVNVIIVSDHGMADVDCDHVVNIHKLSAVDFSDLSVIINGPTARIGPKPNATLVEEDVLSPLLSSLQCRSEHMRAYWKEHLPIRMHYSNNRRIEPIILEVDNGWTIRNEVSDTSDKHCRGGTHGYDNLFSDMKATFLALGPDFKKNTKVEPFENIELYELMCELISIKPLPNNGTRGSLHQLLKNPKVLPVSKEPEPPMIGLQAPSYDLFQKRINASECPCLQLLNETLATEKNDSMYLHLPFGVPFSPWDNSTLRILPNKDYIVGYNTRTRMPAWTAYTLRKTQLDSFFLNWSVQDICWRSDSRLDIHESSRCSEYNRTHYSKEQIFPTPLFLPSFSTENRIEEPYWISNAVPMSRNLSNVLLEEMVEIAVDRFNGKTSYSLVNIITGPAFNYNHTGVRPHEDEFEKYRYTKYIIFPTHFFVVVTFCVDEIDRLQDCEASRLMTRAYLLPNETPQYSCLPSIDVIRKNCARVADVEMLTGIQLFTGLPTYDAIRLRTLLPPEITK